ncbi:MAG: metal-sensing transcriptional repressor [Emergencia sp.]
MRAKKNDVEHKLKIARGQLDGILRMVEDNRYCIDISNQLLATGSFKKRQPADPSGTRQNLCP